MSEKKLTFNITYYLVFQTIMSIMEELHILLTLSKEHKKVFPNAPVLGFRMARAIRITWIEPNYPNLRRVEIWTMWEKNLLGLWFYKYYYDIYYRSINCGSEKVLYLSKCKVCGEIPYIRKAKTKFRYRFNNFKSKQSIQKGLPKSFSETYSRSLLSRWPQWN